MIKLDLDTILEAVGFTCVAFAVLILLLLLLAFVSAMVDTTVDDQCRSRRAGERCVHGKDHPGSHRDRYDDYWN